MDRSKMIAILSAISEGSINPADLVPGRGYFLCEETPGVFRDRHSGISYTQTEADALYEDIERRNAVRKQLISEAADEPMVIICLPDKTKIQITIDIEPKPQVQVIKEPEPEVIEETKKVNERPKKTGPVRFNLMGEQVDRERSEKMNEYININTELL